MPRQHRVSHADLIFHVAARGALRAPIFRDDSDRRRFLTLYRSVATRFRWRLLAFCLMGNHYHLVVETQTATLSKGMQLINGQYASIFNGRHHTSGCLFQGRFWSRPITSDRYLHAVVRYVALNPVNAGLVARADEWLWGGHRELVGLDAPHLVDVARTRGLLGSLDPADASSYSALFESAPSPMVDLSIRAGSELPWDDVIGETVRMAAAGHDVPDLARAVGRDKRTVQRWIASHGR
jgi:REP element-mobilizing transposase RayT